MSKVKNNKDDLKIILSVEQLPETVFAAINNVSSWWIGEITGTTELGEEFVYKYKTFHETTQKVTEKTNNTKIVWTVIKSKINFVEDKEEWLNTEIIFELTPIKKGTEIHFTHKGLTPAIECFEGCSSGWDFYINKSLKSLINTGEGIDPKF